MGDMARTWTAQEGWGVPGERVNRILIDSRDTLGLIETQAPLAHLPGSTLYEVFVHIARQAPDKKAIVQLRSPDDGEPIVIDFASYLARVTQAANLFRALSPDTSPVVAVIAPYLPEALIAMWAGSIAGISLPINPFLELEHSAGIMNAAGANILVVAGDGAGPGIWNRLDALHEAVPTLRHVFRMDPDSTDDISAAAASYNAGGLDFTPDATPDTVCAYLHTGGTTAAPKLVRHTHGGQLLQGWLCGTAMGSEADAVVGHAMPNFHVGGAIAMMVRGVVFGQTLVTLTSAGFRDPGIVANFWNIVRNTGMTSITTAPTTAAAILAAGGDGPATLRQFTTGGGPLSPDLARNFHARYGLWLKEVWGGTEFHGILSCHLGGDTPPRLGSCGLRVPYHGVMSAILNGTHFVREAKQGERGILIARGPALVPGYVEAEADKKFFVTGDTPPGRWATTGDVGTVDENGYIWIFGREKDVIIRGGHNIDSALIDDVLASHPDVLFAAAVGRPCPLKGELPMAYVQLRPSAKASVDALKAFAREHIQERAAVPVEIVLLDEIPMTAVGKVSKPPLRLDAIRRVATEVAQDAVREPVGVYVAEEGGRPVVTLTCAPPDRDALRAAFTGFTFKTAFAERGPDDRETA